jgi:hypothetical protein
LNGFAPNAVFAADNTEGNIRLAGVEHRPDRNATFTDADRFFVPHWQGGHFVSCIIVGFEECEHSQSVGRNFLGNLFRAIGKDEQDRSWIMQKIKRPG